jgi:anti-sigma regulatory factor (Ser/Thr protein kinase)
MPGATSAYRFELRNSFSDIPRMTDWLIGILQELEASDDLANAVRLCVEEAATNVVAYAFAPDTQHRIDIALDAGPERIVVAISDDGVAFDPLAQAAPAPAADLASATIGGLGISLMRQFSTAMTYRREGAINRLEMTFAR